MPRRRFCGTPDYGVSATTDARCITQANTLSTAECQGFPLTVGAGQTNALMWGYSVGAGLDWALTPSIFVRGEFEFVQFAPISNIAVSVASGHVGAGLKF
jgi:opacity protein-like surface antigen